LRSAKEQIIIPTTVSTQHYIVRKIQQRIKEEHGEKGRGRRAGGRKGG
jgi:hypothetical protein